MTTLSEVASTGFEAEAREIVECDHLAGAFRISGALFVRGYNEALRDALAAGQDASRHGTISLYRFELAIERLLAETKGGSDEQG